MFGPPSLMIFGEVVDIIGWYRDANNFIAIFIISKLLCDLIKFLKDNIFEHVNLLKSNITSVMFEEKRMKAVCYRVIY